MVKDINDLQTATVEAGLNLDVPTVQFKGTFTIRNSRGEIKQANGLFKVETETDDNGGLRTNRSN